MTDFQLTVIGDWHLAYCTAASFVKSGVKTVLKFSQTPDGHSQELKPGCPPCPVTEPGFDELRASGESSGKFYSTSSWQGWRSDIWWLAVDTPVDDEDRPDTSVLFKTLDQGLAENTRPSLLALSSQVPIGFCRALEERYRIPVVYVPENLRLGSGLKTFFCADRTVIGADEPHSAEEIQKLMIGFETKFFVTNLVSAEMTKHATNTFLAMSISFANELARIGQQFGVDHDFVASALKADQRIGPYAYVKPGLGFAGGTLPRDLRVLQSTGQKLGVPTNLVNSILDVNSQVDDAILDRLKKLGAESEQKIALLGYSYKADTNTTRRSPAERLARKLRASGYEVHGFDPVLNGADLGELGALVKHHDNFESIPADCRLFVVVTPRPHFREIDWSKRMDSKILDLHGLMKGSPAASRVNELWGN